MAQENPGAGTGAESGAKAGSPAVEVAAGLVFRNGLLLITLRRKDAHLGGLWEFPGGKRDPGESIDECLLRELREELGIEVEIRELVEAITHEYPDKTVHLSFIRCLWKQNEPKAIGCEDFAWVSAAQLVNYRFPEADARLLERLRSTPEWWKAE